MRWKIENIGRPHGGSYVGRVSVMPEWRALLPRRLRGQPEVRQYISADGRHWTDRLTGKPAPYIMNMGLTHQARQGSWGERLREMARGGRRD